MGKTTLGIGIAALAALTVPLLVAPAANATEGDGTPYVIAAWQIPDDGSGWPQTLVAQEDVAVIDEGTLNLLDEELGALGGCHTYQVDIYNDTVVTQTLLDFGVLGGEGSPPEDGVVTWTYFTGGLDCEPPCTEYIVTTWEMPGWDPVVGKTFPQTLVSTSEPTCNPEFPPPPDCTNTQMDIFRADGLLTAAYLADGILDEAEGNDPALWAEMYEGGSGNSWRLYQDTCDEVVTVQFDVPTTAPTCEAGAQFDAVFPIVREGYTITVDRPYDGPGVYTLTATAAEGFAFSGEGDPYVRTTTVTLAGKVVSEECTPDIGGKTIGFWTNKIGAAAGAPIWNAAKAGYSNVIPATMTFAQAQTALKASSSTNLGKDMLRAQFIATALNVQYIAGYGDQHITVPTTSAVDGGQTVTVKQYLADINAAWASLDTKAEIASVQNVLNAINQDTASELFV